MRGTVLIEKKTRSQHIWQ